jgi:hypothetical protein
MEIRRMSGGSDAPDSFMKVVGIDNVTMPRSELKEQVSAR